MRGPANRERIDRFVEALAQRLTLPLRLYLVGEAVLADLGMRPATLDIDYVARAEDPRALADLERLLPKLKEELNVNVEPASPADFMPVPRGALEESRYMRSRGPVSVYHYH